jgi:hypothetical protein
VCRGREGPPGLGECSKCGTARRVCRARRAKCGVCRRLVASGGLHSSWLARLLSCFTSQGGRAGVGCAAAAVHQWVVAGRVVWGAGGVARGWCGAAGGAARARRCHPASLSKWNPVTPGAANRGARPVTSSRGRRGGGARGAGAASPRDLAASCKREHRSAAPHSVRPWNEGPCPALCWAPPTRPAAGQHQSGPGAADGAAASAQIRRGGGAGGGVAAWGEGRRARGGSFEGRGRSAVVRTAWGG